MNRVFVDTLFLSISSDLDETILGKENWCFYNISVCILQIHVSRESNINNITGTSGNVAMSYEIQVKISWPKILQKFTANTITKSYLVITLIGQKKMQIDLSIFSRHFFRNFKH